jgi:radical SAM protein with 4Fe4S-binding SPASM domain
VHRNTFAEMFEGEQVRVLKERNAERLRGYADCPWLQICNGGCPHDA